MRNLKKLLALLPLAQAGYRWYKKHKAKQTNKAHNPHMRADRASDLYHTKSDLTRFK